MDAHAILSLPTRGSGDDVWEWELEWHGLYSVRSAYRQLYDDQGQLLGPDASSSGDDTWARI